MSDFDSGYTLPPERAEEVLAPIDELQRYIMRLSFGLDPEANGQPRTYEEIGQLLGMSALNVRRIQEDGFGKLRNRSRQIGQDEEVIRGMDFIGDSPFDGIEFAIEDELDED